MFFFFSFSPSLCVNKGETEGYRKLTAKEIAVKRSLHFSFSLTVFFLYCQCYWPLVGIWIFKRHFITQSCSYSQGKGGKSWGVFLFYLPLSSDLQMNSGQAFIFPPFCLFLSPVKPLLPSAGSCSSRRFNLASMDQVT